MRAAEAPRDAPALRGAWALDPDILYLNHGSFGACPRAVLAEQDRLRAEMEAEAVRFLIRELEGRLDVARAALAAFVGARPQDLAFVPNATAGVNTVLRSIALAPGDELLVTDHAYPACRNALEEVAARAGARVVVARIPFPLASEDEAIAPLLAAAGPRTRLALVDHVTSPSGLVLPLATIVPELARRGALVLVDGAHAPGMLDLDVAGLGADFYTGNCHKWICSPKGAGFLHVREDRQALVRPLSISHGASSPRTDRSRFLVEADWTGTADPTPFLCVPAAIETMGALLPGGWPELRRSNRDLALGARRVLCEALGIGEPAPESMIGSLAAVPLPPGSGTLRPPLYMDPLQDALWDRSIEVPIFPWPAWPGRLLRVSAQAYSAPWEFEALAAALRELGPGLPA